MKNLKSLAMLGALMAMSTNNLQRGDYMPDLTTPRKRAEELEIQETLKNL